MKHRFMRVTVSLLAAALTLAYPLSAVAVSESESESEPEQLVEKTESTEGVISDGDNSSLIAPINEDFIEYFENPNSRSGAEPSPLNLDYLTDSYADSSLAAPEPLPESYDLRDYGRVTRVRDQGIYGTCWAFEALASANSSILEQFPTTTFSPVHLNWFSFAGDADAEMYQYRYDTLPNESVFNFGGNNTNAVGSLSAWKGPVSSESLPYNTITENGEDLSAFENMRYEADYHLQDAFFLPVDSNGGIVDIEVAKKTLMEYGGLSMAYCSDDKYFNEDTCAQYCPSPLTEAPPDHAVLIVGWDDNYPKENFKEEYRPENDGAWLVQNSWGTLYDKLGGYFWLSYEDKTVYESACLRLESADNYAENYQLDTGGWQMSVTGDETHSNMASSYAANIFTAKDNEQLEAVSFYTTDADAEYQISVYTNPKDNDPTSGELVYFGPTGTEPYAGYHTVELDQAVKLPKGTTFAVVVKLTNPEFNYPIALNTSYTSPRVDKLEYSGARGRSFVSGDGESWTDAVDYSYYLIEDDIYVHLIVSNACIKAFTNPIPSDGEAVSNIRFSLLEGPVALGSKLTLEGADTIMYQIDDGEAKTYNGGVTIDKPCTVTAWGVKNGKSGNKVSRTYTQAAGQLNYLTLKRNGAIENVEIGEDNKAFITINKADSPLSLLACSADDIIIDGEKIASDEWSHEFSLGDGETRKDIKIEVSGDGKKTTEYIVRLADVDAAYSLIGLDIESEKINYDQNAYKVLDENGKQVESGSVISDYAELVGEDSVHQKFFIYDKASGELIDSIPVPQRQRIPTLDFDAEGEIVYKHKSDRNVVYSSSDDDFAHEEHYDEIRLEPGKTYRFRSPADLNYGFASEVKEFIIAPRADAPSVKAESVGVDTIQLTEIDGCEYRIAGEQWQDYPVFTGLEANTSYTFEVRHKCEINKSGNKTFFDLASGISTVEATTLDGIMALVQINYHGMMMGNLYYGLHEGENVIDVNKLVMDYGFIAASKEDEFVKVNAERINGELMPEQDVILNVEMIELAGDGSVVPVNAEDYSFTALYVDGEKHEIVDKQSSNFVMPGIISDEDLNIPDGYELQDDFPPENVEIPYLGYYDGVWRVYSSEITIEVLATESSTDPTESSTDPTESSTDPTESSTDPTESSTDPTESSTDPTESSTDPTESSTDPTEPSTDPTEPSTNPTESSTNPTNAPTNALTTQPTGSADVSLSAKSESKEQNSAGESQGKGDNVYTGENRELVTVIICAFVVSAAFIVGIGLRRRKETDD